MKTTLSSLAAARTAAFGCPRHQPPTDDLASAVVDGSSASGANDRRAEIGVVPSA